jgi:hypothetical protein
MGAVMNDIYRLAVYPAVTVDILSTELGNANNGISPIDEPLGMSQTAFLFLPGLALMQRIEVVHREHYPGLFVFSDIRNNTARLKGCMPDVRPRVPGRKKAKKPATVPNPVMRSRESLQGRWRQKKGYPQLRIIVQQVSQPVTEVQTIMVQPGMGVTHQVAVEHDPLSPIKHD